MKRQFSSGVNKPAGDLSSLDRSLINGGSVTS